MAFGIGFGAFAQGLSEGLGTGLRLGKAVNEGSQRRARQKAIDDAKQSYDKTIADNVLIQAGQAGLGAPFDADAARENAKKKVGSFTDYLYQTALPGIIDTYAQSGDLEGAETLRKWAEDAKERKFMDSFGKTLGYWAAGQSSGDYNQFAKSAVDLLNNGGYGLKATGYELLKDNEGNTTGLSFKLKEGDREFTHTFNSIDEAAQFLSAQGSPANRVKQWMAEREAATKLKADVAKKQMEAQIGLGKDIALEGVKQQGRKELENLKTENDLWKKASEANSQDPKVRAEAQAKANILRESGYNDEQINRWMPQLLGVREEARQRMSNDDLLKLAHQTLSASDPEYMDADAASKNQMALDWAKAFRTQAGQLGGAPSTAQPAAPQRPQAPVFR